MRGVRIHSRILRESVRSVVSSSWRQICCEMVEAPLFWLPGRRFFTPDRSMPR
jgi:hypothetical protein